MGIDPDEPDALVVVPHGEEAAEQLFRAAQERLQDAEAQLLAALAAAEGKTFVSGLDLLAHQAALQVTLMTGAEEPPLEAMRAAGLAALT